MVCLIILVFIFGENEMHKSYLSLGSNIGDREKHLNMAVDILSKSEGIDVVSVQPFMKLIVGGI